MRRLLPIAALPLLLAAGPATVITPGKWVTTVEIVDVKMPGAPPGVAAAMKGRPTTVSTCITPEQAPGSPAPRCAPAAAAGSRIPRWPAAASPPPWSARVPAGT